MDRRPPRRYEPPRSRQNPPGYQRGTGYQRPQAPVRRRNPLSRLAVAMALTGAVIIACHLLVYGLPWSRDAAAPISTDAPTAAPATATPSPTPTTPPTPTPMPTPAPTPAPTPTPPLLVNKQNPLPDDYSPSGLVRLIDVCPRDVVTIKGSEIEGNTEAVQALITMLRAGIADGIGNWQISAGYRSIRYQQSLLDDKIADLRRTNNLSRDKARQAALKTVAPPGASEHHTGLAFDITVPGTTFAGTKQAAWLAENSYRFGYILRYQAHKEEITGFLAEAWHFRYVGVAVATVMKQNDWCLEEYIADAERK